MPATADAPSETALSKPKTHARASVVMWLSMVGVLLLALTLLLGHGASRRASLLDHYDRAAARAASQVALRWSHVAQRLTVSEAQAASEHDRQFAAVFESDGVLTMEPCEAGRDDQALFVSADRLAVVFRRGRDQCGRVLFSTLLHGPRVHARATRARTRRFDQLLLLDGEGKVLAEELETPQLALKAMPLAKPLGSAPTLSSVALGAVEYQAFVRPVRIVGELPAGVPALYVCGLVRQQNLMDDSLQVESSFVLLGIFLLAMAVVALPAAKLWLIGAQVRYRRRDVYVFKAATVIGSVLTLILVFGAVARASLCTRLDEQLMRIAGDLGHQVSSRVQQTAEALQRFNGRTAFSASRAAGADPFKQLAAIDCQPRPAVIEGFPARWNVVFRLDPRGRQTDKFYRQTATPCVDVREREYFRMARHGSLRDLRPLDAALEPAAHAQRLLGAAEVVRARTTGQLSLIVAMPEERTPDHTLVLETSLRDLARQIVPRGIQTAVIDDARGVTMLHSDNAALQEQNFFDDVDRGSLAALRAALQLNVNGAISLEYLGTPSRLYLQPLQAGWTAIAIAPEALVDLPTRKIVLLTLLLCLACSLCVLGIALVRWAIRVSRSRTAGDTAARPSDAPAARAEPAPLEATPPGGVPYHVLGSSAAAAREASARAGLAEDCALPSPPAPHAATPAGARQDWLPRLVRWVPMPGLATGSAVALLVTALLFELSYLRVVEDSVSAELQQAGQQRFWSPECFEAAAGSARANADVDCIALRSTPTWAPDARTAFRASEQKSTKASFADPLPATKGDLLLSMMDMVLKLAEFDSDGVVLPPRAQPRRLVPWVYAREGATLRLHVEPMSLTLTDVMPSLSDGLRLDARMATFLVVTVACLVLALFGTWASLRRLAFARTRMDAYPEVSAARLLAAPKERPLLVLFPPYELEHDLRKLKVLREIKPGDPPSEEPAFIANAQRYFRSPAQLVKTIESYPGRLIVLSTVDWTRGLPPEQRALLDRAFGSFEMWVGPGVNRWPTPLPARRALASELWADSSDDERSFLARLALDGYVAPHSDNEVLLMHLRDRGILRRERLAFAQSEFRTYVRHTVSAHELRNAASIRQNDAWNAVRVPLTTAALLILVFVSYMQPELAALGVPISSLLAAARPLLKLLGLPADG